MASLRLSSRAEADLHNVTDYTVRTWGENQANHYLGTLKRLCWTLADNPVLGRLCDEIRSVLRRFEFEKHVVFYREENGGILISRILYQRMLPGRHSMEDQDDNS